MTRLRQEFEQFQADLRCEGKAAALLAVLGARGVSISEVARQEILAIRDVALVDRLLVQAATADKPEDVLRAAA